MFEKLIVAFDGSDTGVDGLMLSMGLAKVFGSQVAVVYVFDEELSSSSSEAARELAQHADAVLAGARERVSQALAVKLCAVPASSPARGLHELARSEQADLIVLGSRRLGPQTSQALGAISDSVMRAAPCAVAVAPRGYGSSGGFVPQRIGAGWIPTREGDDALVVAYRIARATGGTVELVTTTSAGRGVEELGQQAKRAVESVASALGGRVPVSVRARAAAAADELVDRSAELDLLVVGSRGYGPPGTMVFGSVSWRLVSAARCPAMFLAARSAAGTRG